MTGQQAAVAAMAALGALLLVVGLLLPPRGYDMRPAQPLLVAIGTLLLALVLVVSRVIR